MQQSTNSLDTRYRASVHHFQNAAKRLFLSPLFIIFLASVFSFLCLIVVSFFFEMKNVTIPFTGLFDAMSQFAPWDSLVQINLFAGLAVTALAFIGFVLIVMNMVSNRFGAQCKLGFYMIKMPMFIQNILTLLSVSLTSVKVIRDLIGLIGTKGRYGFLWIDWSKFAIVAIIVVVLWAVYLLYFSYKSLMTVPL